MPMLTRSASSTLQDDASSSSSGIKQGVLSQRHRPGTPFDGTVDNGDDDSSIGSNRANGSGVGGHGKEVEAGAEEREETGEWDEDAIYDPSRRHLEGFTAAKPPRPMKVARTKSDPGPKTSQSTTNAAAAAVASVMDLHWSCRFSRGDRVRVLHADLRGVRWYAGTVERGSGADAGVTVTFDEDGSRSLVKASDIERRLRPLFQEEDNDGGGDDASAALLSEAKPAPLQSMESSDHASWATANAAALVAENRRLRAALAAAHRQLRALGLSPPEIDFAIDDGEGSVGRFVQPKAAGERLASHMKWFAVSSQPVV